MARQTDHAACAPRPRRGRLSGSGNEKWDAGPRHFTFTLYHRDLTGQAHLTRPEQAAALSLHQPEQQLRDWQLASTTFAQVPGGALGLTWHRLQRLHARQRQLGLSRAQRAWTLHLSTPQLHCAPQPWTEEGALRRVVAWLRQTGRASQADLEALFDRLHITQRHVLRELHRHPQLFVIDDQDNWRLTPWVRYRANSHTFDPGGSILGRLRSYEREAARYWLTLGTLPSAQDEWHAGVRQQVEATLHARGQLQQPAPPLPDFVREDALGLLVAETPRGRRRYTLLLHRLPEGQYFTRRWAQGEATYSVEGRAFLEERAGGIKVLDNWVNQRLAEALRDDGQPEVTWHASGTAFKQACQAAGLQSALQG